MPLAPNDFLMFLMHFFIILFRLERKRRPLTYDYAQTLRICEEEKEETVQQSDGKDERNKATNGEI